MTFLSFQLSKVSKIGTFSLEHEFIKLSKNHFVHVLGNVFLVQLFMICDFTEFNRNAASFQQISITTNVEII